MANKNTYRLTQNQLSGDLYLKMSSTFSSCMWFFLRKQVKSTVQGDWSDGSLVKSTDHSSRGSEFNT